MLQTFIVKGFYGRIMNDKLPALLRTAFVDIRGKKPLQTIYPTKARYNSKEIFLS